MDRSEIIDALEGLIQVAELAMPDSHFQTDSRVRKAQELVLKLGGGTAWECFCQECEVDSKGRGRPPLYCPNCGSGLLNGRTWSKRGVTSDGET